MRRTLATALMCLSLLASGFAQVTTAPAPVPKAQFLDKNGAPLAGGLLYSYIAGTATPQNTYTDSTGTVPNSNPVVLDSGGFANVWLGPTTYKLVLKDASGNLQWSVDNIPSESQYLPLSGGTMTGPLFAPVVNNKINPTLMAGGDLGAQINTACAFLSGKPTEVEIPSGSYAVNTTINPASNCWVHGQGSDNTTLTAGVSLGANQIFHPNGSSGSHLTNIHISSMTIENGGASTTGYISGMDGIRADYVDGLEVDHVHVTQVHGVYAIGFKNSTQVKVHDNKVDHNTYANIAALTNSENWWIERNEVASPQCVVNSTPTGAETVCHQTYLVSGGAEATNDGTFYARKGWVMNNSLHDNPQWEGMDLHGGDDIHVDNNVIYNILYGISAGLNTVGTFESAPSMNNLEIRQNDISQGSGLPNGACVLIASDTQANLASNFTVDGDHCSGFGATATASSGLIGAFEFYFTMGGNIQNISCVDWSQACVLFYHDNLLPAVSNVTAYNMTSQQDGAAAIVTLASVGNWGVRIGDNINYFPTSLSAEPNYLIRNAFQGSSITLGKINTNFASTSLYSGSIPAGYTSAPTAAAKLNFLFGDPIWDTNGRINWRVAGTADGSQYGFCSLNTDVIATGNIVSGQPTITNLASGAGYSLPYKWFPPGMNISFASAGLPAPSATTQVAAANVSTITQVAATSTVATYTAVNTLQAGWTVVVAGLTTSALNQTAVVATASGTNFTIAGSYTPVSPVSDSGTATVSGIAAGIYRVCATLLDAFGNESKCSVDSSSTVTTTSTNNVVTVTSPAAATQVIGWKLYMSAASGASGSEIYYVPLTAAYCTFAPTNNTACAIGSNAIVPGLVTGTANPPAGKAPLSARILSNDGTTLTLDTNATSSASSANITYRACSIINAQQVNDFEMVFATNPTTNNQIRFGGGTIEEMSIGTQYSSGGLYESFNAVQTAANVDNWHQPLQSAAVRSTQVYTDNNGWHFRIAPPTSADNPSASFWGTDLVTINSVGKLGPKSLSINGGTTFTQIATLSTASITPSAVTAQTCADQTFTLTGTTVNSLFGAVQPPSTLGNVSVQAIHTTANNVILHFCNPNGSGVTPPAGVYSMPVFN